MRISKVLEEQAIAFRFPLFRATEHGIDLVHPLSRHQPLQEPDGRANVFEVDVKIRARETEQHAYVIDRKYHRVGEDAVVGITQGDDQRGYPVVAANSSDNECARCPIEDRHQEFDDFEIMLDMAVLAVGLDLGRHESNRPFAVPVRHSETEV